MSDIRISIKNYKLIKDYEQVHKDARILLVTGKNEIGKSSMIRALIENITAKSQTDDPVTHGEMTGEKIFTVPDKNGNEVTIVHEFSNTNKKGSFYCIDHEGKKIKEVNRIREIIGVFEEISIDTFYTLQQSAAGRRKIIENYLYPLLTPAQRQEIVEIDKETTKGGELYDARTNANTEIGYLNGVVDGKRPSKEDELLAAEYENMQKEINALEKKKVEQSTFAVQSGHLWERIQELQAKVDNFPSLYKEETDKVNDFIAKKTLDIEDYEARILAAKEDIASAKSALQQKLEVIHQEEISVTEALKNFMKQKAEMPEVENVDKQLAELRDYRDQAYQAKAKIEEYKGAAEKLKAAQERAMTLERKINGKREHKKEILSNSNLPSGLSIEGDDFTWNGFSFSDTQISKSSALLVIAEILCNIVESKIVYLGEKSLFDKDRFKKLVEIAERHGKIPVLEEVVDNQTELKVVTEMEDA